MAAVFTGLLLLLLLFCRNESIYAFEEVTKLEILNNTESCTARCHVNYTAYENKIKSLKRDEIFRHKTHSFEQDLNCTSCHDNSEVNTERHGKLIIEQENCLKCHHVELKESECKRCHFDIDENPMKYKEEKFLHGFTVESDVDCGQCHVKDSNASLKDEEFNCVKCHHTTPDLNCIKCHENDINQSFDADLQRGKSLSWTVSFNHSQHPEQGLSCKECHEISNGNNAGVVEYNLNCSKCHHDSEEKSGCVECHKEPLAYLRGEIGVKEITLIPDMMSRAVKCEDCHKYNSEKLKFGGVEEHCIECHNEDYGKLYNAWTKTIKDRLRECNLRVQNLVEDSNLAFLKESDIDDKKDVEAGDESCLDTFINETGMTVDLITKYGIHNFNLTRMLLSCLEEKIKPYHGDTRIQQIVGLMDNWRKNCR
ncbi:MAG: cytochrome c3 family protein [Candidatus Scalindua sp.]